MSADEFYEATESPAGGDTTTTESPMDAGETTNEAAQRDCTTADTGKLVILNESITADSDGSLPLRDGASSDMHVVDADNAAADTDDQNIHEHHVESVSAKDNSMLELGGSELVNEDQSQLSGDLMADSTQDTSRDDVPVAGDECASDSPSQPASDDTTELQQLDAADSNMPADSGDTQSESVDSNVSQPSDSHIADDADHTSQCDEESADNNQEISCTSLPLHITEEPSTADSNDDPAEYVEASTSLNPDCVDTEPMTGVDRQQQQLEEDDDDKEDEQFVDSASDISPPQPVEGNYY